MDTASMRRQVEAACGHEEASGTLARVTRDACRKERPGSSEKEIEVRVHRTVEAVRSYVRAMPDIVDATLEAAEKVAERDAFRAIFETASAYIDEDVDFIPDEHGLAGLVDDAYLVHGLMQEISRRHAALTGAPLVPDRLFDQSQKMRRLVGEPTATRLDVAVVAFARQNNVRDVVEQIVERIGHTGLSMSLPSSVAFEIDEHDADDLPELQLGSLGDW